MRGIVISTVALFIIAIFSVILLIILIGSNFSPALRNAYCSLVIGLRGALPLPESLKPDLPAYCKEEVYLQTFFIESGDPDRIAFEVASYVLACWERTGKVDIKQNKTCFEVVIKRIDGTVNEGTVEEQLPINYRHILVWEAGVIDRPKSLGIVYRYNIGKVVVL